MKIKKAVFIILMCFIIGFLPGCKNIGVFSSGNTELKIGVEGLSGNYNPFYAQNKADVEIISQMFRPIQIKSTDNSLINYSGSISYEFVGDSQVKYTVSINDDMRFSDGSHITIDDVIFFYHFIADASYDGIYKDWYLNDIVGLKEYYFDDINYEKSILNIERTVSEKYTLSTISVDDYTDYLVKTKLEGKFDSAGGKTPSGQTWNEYLISLGYENEIKELGNKPSEDALLKLAAKAEAENNPSVYNPESWYREYLYENFLKSNYIDGVDVTEISGIKKINDYTCSILFNSRNINAISEINALIIPKNAYSSEYIKGTAEKVKELNFLSVGSGPYIITESAEEDVRMSFNEFYTDESCEFKNLRFIDILAKGYDPIESVVSGKIDIVSTTADFNSVNALKDAPVQYYINNNDNYVSAFFNTRSLDFEARKALMGICNPIDTVEGIVGSYYTRVLSPLNIRFAEYPSDIAEPYYSEHTYSFYSKLNDSPVKNVTAYYFGNESDLEYSFLLSYREILLQRGVSLEIVTADEETYNEAIYSSKADMWIEKVYSGATCDKYDYFNVNGSLNKTGLNVTEINDLTSAIRSAVGLTNKTAMTSQLMRLVMQQAVEWPLYQLQTLTVYNTEKISTDSFLETNESDGFTYFIPKLKANN
ncbi:MAG: hypothetical protein IJB16_02770 [Clostridia bacterium]|nr:hypothetical protein [Clostridia bacterium]